MVMKRDIRLTRTSRALLEALVDHFEDDLWGLKLCNITGLPSGTVYPILSRLEDLGWVATRWEADEDSPTRTTGPRRRFYTLTPDGLVSARAALATPAQGRSGAILPALRRANHHALGGA